MELSQIAGLEALSHEFTQVYNLTRGMEALHEEIDYTDNPIPEVIYAKTVLELNNIELTDVVGSEGFLDSIKKGAKKVYEWIKDLIRAIRNWFTGGSKKEYEEAKKELKEASKEDDFVKAALEVVMAGGVSAAKDPQIKSIIKRLPDSVKRQASESIKTQSTETEAITDSVVNEIAAKVASRISALNKRVEEIKRIDPTGETLEALGLSPDWNFITDGARNQGVHFSKEDQATFAKRVKAFVDNSEEAQRELAKAVLALEKMNEASRGHEGNERGSQLSRAVSVVKELTDIAAIYRDTVMTINSQVQIGYKKAETSIVKNALLDALKNSNEAANQYISDAINSL